MPRHLRIGIDTGGTFTDVVAFDELTGALTVTKTPSTPGDPALGFMTGLAKILGLLAAEPGEIAAVSHGTTIATNQLLEGAVGELGFITTEGFEFMLEIARQTVPDGYGNSYFWVKPDRIVPPDRVKTVAGRIDHTGAELRPFDEAQAIGRRPVVRRAWRHRDRRLLPALLRQPGARAGDGAGAGACASGGHGLAVVAGAARVPRVRAVDDDARGCRRQAAGVALPGRDRRTAGRARRPGAAARDDLKRRRRDGRGGHRPADRDRAERAGRWRGGAAMIAQNAGLTSVLTCDGGGTSTDIAVVVGGEAALTTEGTVGAYPARIPMVDVVTVGAGGGSVAWVSAAGALKVGPRSAGADPGPLCYGKGGREVTVTDAHLVLGRIPPHLLGGEIPLDAGAARAGLADLAAKLGMPELDCAAAPDERPARPSKRYVSPAGKVADCDGTPSFSASPPVRSESPAN